MDTALWRAVLADSHPVWLEAVARILEGNGFELVARTTPGPDALAVLGEVQPDVFITEIARQDGPEYVRKARGCAPETRLVVLAADDEVHVVQEVLLAGANAYIVKTAAAEDLLAAVRQTLDGSVFVMPVNVIADLPPACANGCVPDGKLDELTRRELEILRVVAEGLTNAQLARMLWLSEQTVKFHLSNIYRKLGVSNRTEASRWAQLHGVVGRGEELAGRNGHEPVGDAKGMALVR
jgi:DNA-binding NarL/FixJ family response regulator